MKTLDEMLAAAQPGDVITLGAGVHLVRGCLERGNPVGTVLKPGVQLIGVGPSTVIRVIDSDEIRTFNSSVIFGAGSNQVSSLVIDCGPIPDRFAYKRNGLWIEGGADLNSVHDVMVTGCYGQRGITGATNVSEQEGFAIGAFGKAEITNCIVDNLRGNYGTPIIGANAKISDCYISQPRLTPAPYNELPCWQGIGIVESEQFEVTNNVVLNGKTGFYTDTGNKRQGSLKFNIFAGVAGGIVFNELAKSGARQISITKNSFEIGVATDINCVLGIVTKQTSLVTGVSFEENIVRWRRDDPRVGGARYCVALYADTDGGINDVRVVATNFLDTDLKILNRNLNGKATNIREFGRVDPTNWTTS